jgi:hypothetical protein
MSLAEGEANALRCPKPATTPGAVVGGAVVDHDDLELDVQLRRRAPKSES